MLVNCSCLKCRKNVFRQKLFPQVFDYDLAGARLMRFAHHRLNVIALANVGHHSNHIVGIVLLQPGNNDGGIKTS